MDITLDITKEIDNANIERFERGGGRIAGGRAPEEFLLKLAGNKVQVIMTAEQYNTLKDAIYIKEGIVEG
jgi:hypothetical protein